MEVGGCDGVTEKIMEMRLSRPCVELEEANNVIKDEV